MASSNEHNDNTSTNSSKKQHERSNGRVDFVDVLFVLYLCYPAGRTLVSVWISVTFWDTTWQWSLILAIQTMVASFTLIIWPTRHYLQSNSNRNLRNSASAVVSRILPYFQCCSRCCCCCKWIFSCCCYYYSRSSRGAGQNGSRRNRLCGEDMCWKQLLKLLVLLVGVPVFPVFCYISFMLQDGTFIMMLLYYPTMLYDNDDSGDWIRGALIWSVGHGGLCVLWLAPYWIMFFVSNFLWDAPETVSVLERYLVGLYVGLVAFGTLWGTSCAMLANRDYFDYASRATLLWLVGYAGSILVAAACLWQTALEFKHLLFRNHSHHHLHRLYHGGGAGVNAGQKEDGESGEEEEEEEEEEDEEAINEAKNDAVAARYSSSNDEEIGGPALSIRVDANSVHSGTHGTSSIGSNSTPLLLSSSLLLWRLKTWDEGMVQLRSICAGDF